MPAQAGLTFQWQPGTLQKMLSRMKVFGGAVKSAPQLALEYWGPILVLHAQQTARWRDRTGDARRGISYEVVLEDNLVTLNLFHTVSYGIWLEIRWQGRFAVIGPTVILYQDQIMADLPRFVSMQLPSL